MFPEIKNAFLKASRRIFFFDYDGTLVPFSNNPENALPDSEIRESLNRLSRMEGNTVAIISGRDRIFLDKIFKGMNLILIAEHGVFVRIPGHPWKSMSFLPEHTWKTVVINVLAEYVDAFPGTMIEEKESCIAWHYRNAVKMPSSAQKENLKNLLGKFESRFRTEVLEGNQVIEIKNKCMNKGIAANALLKEVNPDFIMAMGDDLTDEYLFRALPEFAFTIKIGNGNTHAKYCCLTQENVARLIGCFLE